MTNQNNKVSPIKIAILAMGGEGGGVLADWIVDMGEHNGYLAQTTSVPGVAQRTGATIYYVELYPRAQAEADGALPVFALMPLPGDVDVVLASELMEAGRAVQRGLVTPDRTTLISSTHRVYSIPEKSVPGDGRVDSDALLGHAARAARRFIRFDMAELAESTGSVISAAMFGALCGAQVLPFSREQFEATVERGGVGVKTSLKAFGAAFERAQNEGPVAVRTAQAQAEPRPTDPAVKALVGRVRTQFPAEAHGLLFEGVRRMVDYQDPAYADLYLDRVRKVLDRDGSRNVHLAQALARHLALWMSYEDTIRVADVKIRASRFERVKSEVKLEEGQLIAIEEFMHPRLQEICETLPAGLGRWLLGSGWPRRLVERKAARGRVVHTSSLRGFLLLYFLASLRRWRRSTLRYQIEEGRIAGWLARIESLAPAHPELAAEVAECQRLVKGYGDTHERGLRNYETLMAAFDQRRSSVTPAMLRAWREAALADEHGERLKTALASGAEFALAGTVS